jgi:hypothetical protein
MLTNISENFQAYSSNIFKLCMNKLKIANVYLVKGDNSNKIE